LYAEKWNQLNCTQIRYILESLVYALNASTSDLTTKRIILQDFVASMNRKALIANGDVDNVNQMYLAKLER
jgi:hypothetical protein